MKKFIIANELLTYAALILLAILLYERSIVYYIYVAVVAIIQLNMIQLRKKANDET